MFNGCNVALVTPMLENGSVDYDSLRTLVDYQLENGIDGLVIMGTTGESATLLLEEQLEVLDTVIKQVAGRTKIIVGNGSNCTRSAIKKTLEFNKRDIDGYLTVVPYYNKPSAKGLIAHFTAIAEAADKPTLLYNVPGRTVVDMQPETIGELAKVDGIVGLKDASGDPNRVGVLRDLCGPDFCLLSGDDLSTREFILAGGNGSISVTANVAPGKMTEMCHLAAAGQAQDAKKLDEQLTLLHQRLFLEPSPSPAKWALQQMSVISSDSVRLPLIPLEPISAPAVKEAMEVSGIPS